MNSTTQTKLAGWHKAEPIGDPKYITVKDANGKTVCRVPFGPMDDAQANLIASAPDLLAALESSQECLCAILEPTQDDNGNTIPNPLLVQIDAALARARGL